jgi:hypothetical protein
LRPNVEALPNPSTAPNGTSIALTDPGECVNERLIPSKPFKQKKQ